MNAERVRVVEEIVAIVGARNLIRLGLAGTIRMSWAPIYMTILIDFVREMRLGMTNFVCCSHRQAHSRNWP